MSFPCWFDGVPWQTNLQGPLVRASSPFTKSWTFAHDMYATKTGVGTLGSALLPLARIWFGHVRLVYMKVHAIGV